MAKTKTCSLPLNNLRDTHFPCLESVLKHHSGPNVPIALFPESSPGASISGPREMPLVATAVSSKYVEFRVDELWSRVRKCFSVVFPRVGTS